MEQKNKSRKHLSPLSPENRQAAEQKRTSAVMGALKAIHSATSPDSMDPADLNRQRRGRLVAPMLGMSWEPFDLQGMPAAWVRPERGHDRRHVILYCHGGGYTSGNLGYARILAAKLAGVTGYEVLAFEYRLAPEHTYPAPLEDAMKAWDYLMHLGYGARDVVVAGDSAGGNLALVLTMRLREENRRLSRRLEDARLVCRAKCLLIQYGGMTEEEAHHAVERRAMDRRRSRREAAEEIIAAYEGEAAE